MKALPENNDTTCGFAAIVGAPNVGKSTLLNALVGEKVAIVSHKPNTTRNRVAGIVTKNNAQAIFLDTPGIHHARDILNKRMVKTAMAAIRDVDLIIFMVEAEGAVGDIEKHIANKTAETGARRFLVVNKIDRVEKPLVLPRIEELIETLGEFDEVIPASALKGHNVDAIERLTLEALPLGPMYYPEDVYTDRPERFIVAEMIRERVFANTGEEIPYATAVTIEEWDESPTRIFVRARIHVERKSQKGIVIGRGGAMLKKIGAEARSNMEKMLGIGVFLELFVDVIPKWRKNTRVLDSFGYTEEDK